ncbi:MAG: helix-turn-helix domain-containing protein [Chthoniobacteraceae bacterium]
MNTSLFQQLARIERLRGTRPPLLEASNLCFSGLETRRTAYDWDGLKRGGDPRQPVLLMQYTLEGEGCFSHSGREWRLEPGMAFFAIIPSAHRYHLPVESSAWSFFYLWIRQDYVVRRVAERLSVASPVHFFATDSLFVKASIDIYEAGCRQTLEDGFEMERLLFNWLVEFERAMQQILHPREPRQRMLEDIRAYVIQNLGRSFGVEELARLQQMSRSNFSHCFHAVTGMSPALFITKVRLAEVNRLLRNGTDTLEKIAAETGFADANHLCKVFQRHFGITPGMLRKMYRA